MPFTKNNLLFTMPTIPLKQNKMPANERGFRRTPQRCGNNFRQLRKKPMFNAPAKMMLSQFLVQSKNFVVKGRDCSIRSDVLSPNSKRNSVLKAWYFGRRKMYLHRQTEHYLR